MLKVNVILDLEETDGLEKVEVNGETYYKLESISVENAIKEAINQYILGEIKSDLSPSWYCDSRKSMIKEAIMEHKDEIIEGIVNKVSKSISNSKQIKEFKNKLTEEVSKND